MASSNVVFVGSELHRQIFDEREVFSAPMGSDCVMFGPAGDYTYGPGDIFKFSVVPNRISVAHNTGQIVLSKALQRAATIVTQALQAQNEGHGVTGLGINFDTVFVQSEDGVTGADFCQSLANVENIRATTLSSVKYVQPHVVVLKGGVQYTIRFEPHHGSGGANLYFSINGHQNVDPNDDLQEKLGKIESVRSYVNSLCDSLQTQFQGHPQP